MIRRARSDHGLWPCSHRHPDLARGLLQLRQSRHRAGHGASPGNQLAQGHGRAPCAGGVSIPGRVGSYRPNCPSPLAFLVRDPASFFDRMSGKVVELNYISDLPLLLGLAARNRCWLGAGAYPALVLSGFRPAAALRQRQPGVSSNCVWSAGSTQSVVFIGLGIAALVVFAQISYARSIDLGLDRDGIVVVNVYGVTRSTLESFTHALNADPVTGAYRRRSFRQRQQRNHRNSRALPAAA